MRAPPVRILDRNLELLGEIDRYRELYFTRSLVEPGDFALMVPFDDEMAGLVREDAFLLLDPEGNKLGIIEETDCATFERGSPWITARGHEAKALLGRKIVLPPEGTQRLDLSGPAESVMKTLVRTQCGDLAESARRVPTLSIPPDAARGTRYRLSAAYSSLLSELCACANAAGLGFSISLAASSRTLTFDIIEGIDRSAGQQENPRALFALEYDTLRSAQLLRGTTGQASTLYVLGATTNEARLVVPTWLDTEPEGLARTERALDAPTIDTPEELSDYGRARLASLTPTFFLEVELAPESPLEPGSDYELGDLCGVHAYGAWVTVPITSIEERWTTKGNGIRLGFGKPTKGAFRTALGAAQELTDLVRAR